MTAPVAVPITVRFGVLGADDLVRRLEAFEVFVNDLRPAWPAVDRAVQTVVALQFRSEGSHGGETWPALAKRTQAERRRLGFPPAHPILRRTGALEESLTKGTGDTISAHLPAQYRYGTAVPYFVYHQSKAPRMRLPRRAPVEMTADDRNEVMRPLRVYLRGGLPGGSGDFALRNYAARFTPGRGR